MILYTIIYLTLGFFYSLNLKLTRFYEFNRYELAFIWIAWPFIMFSMAFFGLAGVDNDEED